MMSMNNYLEMIEVLKKQKNLILTGHLSPDADCCSSLLALYWAFDGAKKGWQIVLEDDISFNLEYLPGIDLIKKPQDIIGEVEAILLVDCGEYNRVSTGWVDCYFELPLYIIDHHQGKPQSAALVVQEPHTCAAALVVYNIIKAASCPISYEIAMLLYSGIAADTGCFRYSNTNQATFFAAAELMSYDIDLQLVQVNLFERRSLVNTRIIAAALNSLQLFYDGQLCVLSINMATKQKYQAQDSDCLNIVNNALMVEGVKFGIFAEERQNGVKVSLRCRDGYAVNEIAAEFGGGGHIKASGCTLECSLDKAIKSLVEAVGKALAEA